MRLRDARGQVLLKDAIGQMLVKAEKGGDV
jgi:hypothetical protein